MKFIQLITLNIIIRDNLKNCVYLITGRNCRINGNLIGNFFKWYHKVNYNFAIKMAIISLQLFLGQFHDVLGKFSLNLQNRPVRN